MIGQGQQEKWMVNGSIARDEEEKNQHSRYTGKISGRDSDCSRLLEPNWVYPLMRSQKRNNCKWVEGNIWFRREGWKDNV